MSIQKEAKLIQLIKVVIAGFPAYFLGKVFARFIPSAPGIVKQIVFLLWFLTLTLLFIEQLSKLKIINQKWSYARIPALALAIILAANLGQFIPMIIPDEHVIALFRFVFLTTGIVIPLAGMRVVFAIVSTSTLIIATGTLYQLYDLMITKASEIRRKRVLALTEHQSVKIEGK